MQILLHTLFMQSGSLSVSQNVLYLDFLFLWFAPLVIQPETLYIMKYEVHIKVYMCLLE
jgi:hypothetical protein